MMTKKSEMAEWILDFFRNFNIDVGQIIVMRVLQNKLHELNPKERDLFVPVANELIENGYFTYEEGPLQCFRLTQKGRDYIYNPDAILDCCYDERKLTPTQEKYIREWHDSFVNFIEVIKGFIASLLLLPSITDHDKAGLDLCKLLLDSADVKYIEQSLAEGKVSQEVLDKIEKLDKDLIELAVEKLQTDVLTKQFLKKLSYLKIEQDKRLELSRLKAIKIPLAT